jgi:hypothetical protein
MLGILTIFAILVITAAIMGAGGKAIVGGLAVIGGLSIVCVAGLIVFFIVCIATGGKIFPGKFSPKVGLRDSWSQPCRETQSETHTLDEAISEQRLRIRAAVG